MPLKPLIDVYLNKTRSAYMWTRILNTPFWALYTLLPFIIYKDLHATAWQVACIISFKPIASVLSLYWSSLVKRRSDRLLSNIIWAGVFGHLPFFLAPFIDGPWYFVLASGIYMIFHRGMNPAWMEILKINVPEESRKSVFAYSSAVYHVGGAFLSLGLGWILSEYYQAWRWIFPLTATLSLFSIYFQIYLPIRKHQISIEAPNIAPFLEQWQKPWKEAWNLIKERPDFFRYQIGFMLGGGGLMLWQPALPAFFFDTLNLSYKELTVAMTFCKGIGYTLALPLWMRFMGKMDIFVFSGLVTLCAFFFPLGVMMAKWDILFLYGAYLLYGMMQAGSELSWNLSGPIFSRHEDSSTYSGVNVVSAGLRGFIAPPLGSFLCTQGSAASVLLLGGAFCLLATWQMFFSRYKEKEFYPVSGS